jgi:hypothetical protein
VPRELFAPPPPPGSAAAAAAQAVLLALCCAVRGLCRAAGSAGFAPAVVGVWGWGGAAPVLLSGGLPGLLLDKEGALAPDREDEILKAALVVSGGKIVHPALVGS